MSTNEAIARVTVCAVHWPPMPFHGLGPVVQIVRDDGTVALGRGEQPAGGRLAERSVDAAGAQPPNTQVADEIVSVDVLRAEPRRSPVSSVGHSHSTANPEATLGEVRPVAHGPTDTVVVQPFDERRVEPADQGEVLHEPADLVVRQGRYDCAALIECAAQLSRDVVLPSALPRAE